MAFIQCYTRLAKVEETILYDFYFVANKIKVWELLIQEFNNRFA